MHVSYLSAPESPVSAEVKRIMMKFVVVKERKLVSVLVKTEKELCFLRILRLILNSVPGDFSVLSLSESDKSDDKKKR